MKDKILRSPFFYVGDKYKLMPQLKELFPNDITMYVEPFVGGGSSFLNTKAESYYVNDIDDKVIELHKYLSAFSGNKDEFFELIFKAIDEYGLSCSYLNKCVPESLKKKYVKTYYSHYNKEAYCNMRNVYNETHDLKLLYLLLIYGFNHMIRFNSSGKFNLPVGNVDFNSNVYCAICDYLDFFENNEVNFYNKDFIDFLKELKLDENAYVYFDPPYLISDSEYNKLWGEDDERRLCDFLDYLNEKGIRFGVTNLINHKGQKNDIFIEWAKKYYVYNIKSNYISFNDNTIKENSKEVFVTNYVKK